MDRKLTQPEIVSAMERAEWPPILTPAEAEKLLRLKISTLYRHACEGRYRLVRINGRSIVELDPIQAPKVRRIFELFAFSPLTLETLIQTLARQGIVYTERQSTNAHRMARNGPTAITAAPVTRPQDTQRFD